MLDAFITQYSLNILIIPLLVINNEFDVYNGWIKWLYFFFVVVMYSFLLIERNNEVIIYRLISIVSMLGIIALDALIISITRYDLYKDSLYVHLFRLCEKISWDVLFFVVIFLDYIYFGSGILGFDNMKPGNPYLK